MMRGVNFSNADLRGVDFTDANLDEVDLKNANLARTQFGKFPDLLGHTDKVSSVAISKDNKLIVSGSEDNTVKIINIIVSTY